MINLSLISISIFVFVFLFDSGLQMFLSLLIQILFMHISQILFLGVIVSYIAVNTMIQVFLKGVKKVRSALYHMV